MTAIETTLHWNKVIGIYSLTSTGQYVSLTIGGGTFVSVCWRLVQQEGVSIPVHTSLFPVLTGFSGADGTSGADVCSIKISTASN